MSITTRYQVTATLSLLAVTATLCAVAAAAVPARSAAATVTGTPGPLPTCVALDKGANPHADAQVTSFADGGRLFTYEQDGQEIVLPQPPSDFDPLRASDAALRRYGFQPRPAAGEAAERARWESTMSGYRGSAPPVSCTGAPPARTGITGEVRHGTVEGSYNWSGFNTQDAGNKYHWDASWADYFQINGVARTSCKSSAIASAWVGLGGSNPQYAGLVQAGTDAFTNGATAAWYEWIAGSYDGQAYFPEIYVYPGDHVAVAVEYQLATETATFAIFDANTGVYRSVLMPGLPPQFYDGSSGDFIIERPGGATGYYPLLNFGSTAFYNARVKNSTSQSWVWLGEPNHVQEQMWSGGGLGLGSLLASPGALTSVNSFTDTYYRCQ